MNKVHLVGRLGADPELKGEDGSVCRLRLATDERRKVDGEWQTVPEWHTVIVFGNQGRSCAEHLKKGRFIAVIGRLATNKWEDKSGNTRHDVQVLANEIEWLGGGDHGGN